MLHKRVGALALAAMSVAVVAACSEDLDSGSACPVLCPDQNIPLRDTLLSPVVIDTSFTGIPPIGTESFILLASRGDTLQTRGILRFDSLPNTFIPTAGDTVPITEVDSSYVVLRLFMPGAVLPEEITFNVYDVDSEGPDTVASALAPLFRPERLLGSETVTREFLTDTATDDSVRVALSNAAILEKIQSNARLRLGVEVVGVDGRSAQVRIGTVQSQLPARVIFDPSPDTAVRPLQVGLRSMTPADDPRLAADLLDYTIVLRGSQPPASTELVVGGLPARRVYMRFDLPSRIVDSTTVVRATLLLTQVPGTWLDPSDTVAVVPNLVTASRTVTEPTKAALLFTPGVVFGVDSLLLVPEDGGVRELDLVRFVRFFSTQDEEQTPRAIMLRVSGEASLPREFRFYSSEAPPELRPRLRLTYIPRVEFGIP